MDLTTQLYYLWFLVLSHGYILPSDVPRENGYTYPVPLDIFDPLHLGLFGPGHPRPGLFGHHHRHHNHPGRPDFVGPPNGFSLGDPNQNSKENRNPPNGDNKVTTASSPLKVNLLSEENVKNNTNHKNDAAGQLQKKESEIHSGNNSSQPIKDIIQPTILGKNEHILRINENKTIGTTPKMKEIWKLEDNASIPDKTNITNENTNSGDSIVFPDSVEEVKSKFRNVSDNLNKSCYQNDTCHEKQNNAKQVNYTKNMDTVVFPVQAFSVNPVQDTNGKVLLVPVNGNPQNQTLPISNNVFPNRPAVYTIVNPGQGPLYTNIINTVPQNAGQPLNPVWNNGNNNNYQNPSPSLNPSFNSGVIYPNEDNFNPNIVNSNPSGNIVTNPYMNAGNTPVSPNLVGIPATTLQQQPTTNGYNIQPNYNGAQQSLQPVNGLIQQSVSTGVGPNAYNNVQGNIPQNGVQNTPNYNGNIAQTFVPVNIVPNNNIQPNLNAQQFYVLVTNQPNNNYNSDTQPPILNSQGTVINSNPTNVMSDNTQKYVLVNANQQNMPQNILGSNLYTMQNGQLKALVPAQVSNSAIFNNAVNQMTPVNVQPNTYLQNSVNPEPNFIAMSSNTNQPNLLLVNGIPNDPILLNSQTSNLNGQNPVMNYGQASNLNGQNILVNPTSNGKIVNLGNNVQNPITSGKNLYTLVTVPNNYGGNGGYIRPWSANLVSLKDKADKEGHPDAAGNSTA